MSMGTLALTGLLLAAGLNPVDVVPINQRNFQIPIRIDASRRHEIKELILFASADQGATWNQVAVSSPDKDAFVYYAPDDGTYWFSVCVVDQRGNREPRDIYKTTPGQKVMVDTRKPVLRITSADRQGDEVVVGWDMQEDHPDLGSLKLEYRMTDAPGSNWTPVALTAANSGAARFRVNSTGPVSVRMQVQDLAGNAGAFQAEIQGTAGSPALAVGNGGGIPNSFAGTVPMIPPPSAPPAIATTQAPGNPASPVTTAVPTLDRAPGVQTTSLATSDPRIAADRALPGVPAGNEPGNRLVASSEAPSNLAALLQNGNAGRPARSSPQAELTNNPQVTLSYEVSKVGPSGVGSVELYLTQDDGQTWRRFAEDPDLKPPMTVDLPGEGMYGLYLVVKSRAGLGKRPPQRGDLPQMRVEVDTTPPLAELYEPQPDAQRPGHLTLGWSVSDRNMGPNPITLQWAERPDGPWQSIAAELPNTGRYTWQLPANLPGRVHLKLIARDAAGNQSIAQTREPQLVDLSEPEGQLTGVLGGARRP